MRSIAVNEDYDIQVEDTVSIYKLLCDKKNLNIDLGEIFSIYLFYKECYDLYYDIEILKELKLYNISEASDLTCIKILSSNHIIEIDNMDYMTILNNTIQSKSLLLASSPRISYDIFRK